MGWGEGQGSVCLGVRRLGKCRGCRLGFVGGVGAWRGELLLGGQARAKRFGGEWGGGWGEVPGLHLPGGGPRPAGGGGWALLKSNPAVYNRSPWIWGKETQPRRFRRRSGPRLEPPGPRAAAAPRKRLHGARGTRETETRTRSPWSLRDLPSQPGWEVGQGGG